MKKKYVIRLPFEPNDSNNRHYEETNDGDVAIFGRKVDAVMHIINNELGDESIADIAIVESIGTCKKCGSPLFPSDIDEYESQCFTCDEDFYSIEQECEKE